MTNGDDPIHPKLEITIQHVMSAMNLIARERIINEITVRMALVGPTRAGHYEGRLLPERARLTVENLILAMGALTQGPEAMHVLAPAVQGAFLGALFVSRVYEAELARRDDEDRIYIEGDRDLPT